MDIGYRNIVPPSYKYSPRPQLQLCQLVMIKPNEGGVIYRKFKFKVNTCIYECINKGLNKCNLLNNKI